MLLGAVLVYFKFPRLADENRLLVEYQAQDRRESTAEAPLPSGAPVTSLGTE